MLPYITDQYNNSREPPLFMSKIKFSDRRPFDVCTDRNGLRVNCGVDLGLSNSTSVVTIGDSQAFGWNLPFKDTFTSIVNVSKYHSNISVPRILGAASADPESLETWVGDVGGSKELASVDLKIITINLGNDIDEVYFGRAVESVSSVKKITEWFTLNSYVFLDFLILKNALRGSDWSTPPGANPVLFSLTPDEQLVLASGLANAVKNIAEKPPLAKKTVVLIIPNDYQVDAQQFWKYERFYKSSTQFRSWSKKLPEAISRLDAIAEQLISEFRSQGVIVSYPLDLLKQNKAEKIIDSQSHHYTALGHKIIAKSILNALSDDDDEK